MNNIKFPWKSDPIKDDILKELKKRSKKNCNKCNNRGFTGWQDVPIINKQTGEKLMIKKYIPCKCIYKNK